MSEVRPQIALMTASDTDRVLFVPAIAMFDAAEVTWEFNDRESALRGAAVVICLARANSDSSNSELAIRCARATSVPVLAVPWPDSIPTSHELLLSALDFPPELGIGVLAIGEAGMKNAALSAISILALEDERIAAWWERYRHQQTAGVLAERELP